mmetsp:Transcript_47058/g.114848  ORF Transcript_47058/g.114848 Transcript_47058/m.114848 type:complete len:83 (+) Transcript_47058:1701-1949(+)
MSLENHFSSFLLYKIIFQRLGVPSTISSSLHMTQMEQQRLDSSNLHCRSLFPSPVVATAILPYRRHFNAMASTTTHSSLPVK